MSKKVTDSVPLAGGPLPGAIAVAPALGGDGRDADDRPLHAIATDHSRAQDRSSPKRREKIDENFTSPA